MEKSGIKLLLALGVSFVFFQFFINNKSLDSIFNYKRLKKAFIYYETRIEALKKKEIERIIGREAWTSSSSISVKLYNPNKKEEVLEGKVPTISKEIMLDERNLNPRIIDLVKKHYSIKGVKKNVNNGIFRVLIWRDLFREMVVEEAFFGFGFGKPTRSESLEILRWGESEWGRDGWVSVHNSYFHIIYRTGIVGVVLLGALFWYLIGAIRFFLRTRDLVGILFCSIIINWFVAANFLVIFEVPYTAIPMWSFVGVVAYYYNFFKRKETNYELKR